MRPEEYHKLANLEEKMWFFRALNRCFVHWLGRMLPVGTAKILDAGCGTGGAIKALCAARATWTVSGLDYSALACALARQRTGREITEGSITGMPFPDEAFDAIFSADVVCQVEDPSCALRELARCVKRGGVVVVNVPAYMWLWSYHDESVQNLRRFTRREILRQFRDAGLDVVYATYANTFLLLPAILRRKLFPPKVVTSDVALLPAPIEMIFSALAWLEFQWTRHGWPLPAGLSVFVVGRRR